MSTKNKLVIFDLDGTLLNTLEDLCHSLNFVLEKYNYQKVSIEETKKFIGNGIRILIKRAVKEEISDSLLDEMYKDYLNYYQKHLYDFTIPYNGINDLLNKLKEKDIKLAVLSNKNDSETQKIISHFFPNTFDYVGGKKDSFKPKPDNKETLFIINKLNALCENTIFIGDTEIDYMTAKNANISPVLVRYGYRGNLLESLDSILVNDTNEIYDYIVNKFKL